MHARHYSPVLGRFIQPDPSRQDASLFGYALDNPISHVDPSGHGVWAFWFFWTKFPPFVSWGVKIWCTDRVQFLRMAVWLECKWIGFLFFAAWLKEDLITFDFRGGWIVGWSKNKMSRAECGSWYRIHVDGVISLPLMIPWDPSSVNFKVC
jgi:hypothetical protein